MTIVLDKVLEDQVTQGVNALVQTVAYNVKLVRGIDSEIKDLTSDIQTFSARLVEASKNSWANDHHVLRVVVKKFRTVVNEAQDSIADYVALKEKHGDNNAFTKSLDKIPFCGKIHDYASEIQSIKAKLDKIWEDHGQELLYLMTHKINEQNKAAQPTLQLQAQPTVEKVGFKDDLEVIKANILLKASNNFTVIPIVGIIGTGKTIFASMIFEDKDIRKKFICHIWIHVAQGFDRKEKFIDIFYQITKRTEDISMMTEDVLARKIYEHLEDKKYLVVLDNLRKKEDWDSFKVAFPENSEGSIVMVTTPYGNAVDSYWKSHNLGKLSNEEGWVLLKNNVFGTKGCNDQLLEGIGKEIAKKCNELPLALVVVTGILRQCGNIADWKRVAENPFLEINREGQSYREQLKLNYNDLPHEKLKNCFLYFAYFPIGYEIVVWKLICLWIAEEFIPTIDEWGYTLDTEVEAQKYLNELVNRNLVIVTKRRTDGQIKTCCIHSTFHEFCKSEAARINLFHVMDEGQRLDENTSSIRRLCFHSFTKNTSSTHPLYSHYWTANKCAVLNSKHIHSLLLSSLQKSETKTTSFAQEQLTTIPSAFPLLRVLNIESIMLIDLQPNELYNLHLLRYVAIRSNLNILPKSFKNLRKLEVLVIKTTARTLQIDGGIWNMEKLRHVHTNTSAQLPFPPKTHSVRICIRTLSTISPTSCTKEIFSKTPNLQKLGVRGNLAELLEEKHGICLFNNLEMLKNLENLKLYGQYDKVLRLPMGVMHTSRLKKMTLSGTLFEWKDMFILGMLEDLEVLKLDEYAFNGEHWVLSKHYVFKRLQYLCIGRTNLVTWDATEDSFPTLRSLVLRNCNFLERIPDAFANIHTLEMMELFHMSENAVVSTKEVTKKLKNSGFQLVITSQKREDLQTAAMRVEIKQAVSERVDRLVHSVACNVEWSRGLASEIKDLTSDIETFNARVVEASINPFASLNVLIVEKFRTVVNEANDAVGNYFAMETKHGQNSLPKSFHKIPFREKVNIYTSEIQSISGKVNTIRRDHGKDLIYLQDYKHIHLPPPQVPQKLFSNFHITNYLHVSKITETKSFKSIYR
nr:putative late blight resistance protein homolog R1B-14 [Ipomoea batatas]